MAHAFAGARAAAEADAGSGRGSASQEAGETFQLLTAKAERKFSRLRDLPLLCRRPTWEPLFLKAFETYSKLWRFQQEYRAALTEAGLKRWEVGEIASKIGQLYYTYYLRTAEQRFLHESFTFYDAIRTRHYFANCSASAPLSIKLLRFYARFIVVCVMLGRRELAQTLLEELTDYVERCTKTFQASDAQDWRLVVHEINCFLRADRLLPQLEGGPHSMRLGPDSAAAAAVARPPASAARPSSSRSALGPAKQVTLTEAVVVSHYYGQVKFSELTLDTHRMLQSLEWELDSNQEAGGNGVGTAAPPDPDAPVNPRKHIMYRPTARQLLLGLATVVDEMPADAVLLFYISACSVEPASEASESVQGAPHAFALAGGPAPVAGAHHAPEDAHARHDNGTKGPSSSGAAEGAPTGKSLLGEDALFYPSDLLPFTRRPLFVIVDSDHSRTFESVSGAERGEPVVLLLSPHAQPPEMEVPTRVGTLFTLFLTSPLVALCEVLNVRQPPSAVVASLSGVLERATHTWAGVLAGAPDADPAWVRAASDPFLLRYAVHFVLCRAVLGLHRKHSRVSAHQPHCVPALPQELGPGADRVTAVVHEIARVVGKGADFHLV